MAIWPGRNLCALFVSHSLSLSSWNKRKNANRDECETTWRCERKQNMLHWSEAHITVVMIGRKYHCRNIYRAHLHTKTKITMYYSRNTRNVGKWKMCNTAKHRLDMYETDSAVLCENWMRVPVSIIAVVSFNWIVKRRLSDEKQPVNSHLSAVCTLSAHQAWCRL